jgi:NAD-dependent dihydropyrimidine dehydrogenase PreA subunit
MARAIIEINTQECVGCKKCMNACTTDVYRYDADNKKIVPEYPDECEWCLICEVQCPKACIRVIPEKPVYVPDPFK